MRLHRLITTLALALFGVLSCCLSAYAAYGPTFGEGAHVPVHYSENTHIGPIDQYPGESVEVIDIYLVETQQGYHLIVVETSDGQVYMGMYNNYFAVNGTDPLGLAGQDPHWHHMVMDTEKIQEIFAGVTHNGQPFSKWRNHPWLGVIAVGEEHIGDGSLHHGSNWNRDLLAKLQSTKGLHRMEGGKKVLDMGVLRGALMDLAHSDDYRDWHRAAVNAPLSYSDWKAAKAEGHCNRALRTRYLRMAHANRTAVKTKLRARAVALITKAGPAGKVLVKGAGATLGIASAVYGTKYYVDLINQGHSPAVATQMTMTEVSLVYGAGHHGTILAQNYLGQTLSNSSVGEHTRMLNKLSDNWESQLGSTDAGHIGSEAHLDAVLR